MELFDVYPLLNVTPVSAKGAFVYDATGKAYLDLYGGHAVISVGHSHPHYVNALKNQLDHIGFYSNSVKIPAQEKLAALLGEVSGYPDYKLFLCNSGAEANENALKLASFHTGRKKVIAFSKSFHGRTSLAVSITDDPKIRSAMNDFSEVVFLPVNNYEAFTEAMSDEVAAVIIEGIQGVGGVVVPEINFLQLLRSECTKQGSVLILDEIQSGYGRSGTFFAHQQADIRADLISVAKGMGNGFPVAGVLISPEFKARHGLLGTTFGGNYLACAASLAVLEIIQNENLMENASGIGAWIMQTVSSWNLVREVRGKGLMIGIELHESCAKVRTRLLNEYGILTGTSSNPNTLRILPPLSLNKEEAHYFLNSFHTILNSEQ